MEMEPSILADELEASGESLFRMLEGLDDRHCTSCSSQQVRPT